MAGRKFQIGNVSLYIVKKDYSYLCMWMTYNWLERNKILIRCGNYSTKKSIWENQHLSWIIVYLGCTQRQCEISKDIVDNYRTMFESRISAGGVENYHSLKIFVFLRGLMIWRVMQRSVWNDIVSWRTRLHNNSTKYLLHASMTTNSRKKK